MWSAQDLSLNCTLSTNLKGSYSQKINLCVVKLHLYQTRLKSIVNIIKSTSTINKANKKSIVLSDNK